ncbi:gliding motility lipoprotein GldH [uncultured Hymenobacter sp.]|uniref:gliding motility lipoprotein GldH n=1 Tax=uncultured Hymenobacter sp. TaxID=170016 RepID=UPI0035C97395
MPDNPLILTKKKQRPTRQYLLVLVLPLLLAACDPNRVFEENTDFKDYSWDVQQKPSFTFQIQDTAARYNLYFNVRNASAYGYYNLYLKHTLTGPAGPVGSPRLHEITLMDPKTGEPRGSGTGDIFDHQVLALPNLKFAQPGAYTLTMEQYMRQSQLPGLMAVGLRVAKVGK